MKTVIFETKTKKVSRIIEMAPEYNSVSKSVSCFDITLYSLQSDFYCDLDSKRNFIKLSLLPFLAQALNYNFYLLFCLFVVTDVVVHITFCLDLVKIKI